MSASIGDNITCINLIKDEDFVVGKESLTLFNKAFNKHIGGDRSFVLNLNVRSKPDKNTALSGLYLSDRILCTQCEAEVKNTLKSSLY